MLKFDVQIALEAVAEARKEWEKAKRKFDADVEYIMKRLLNEAAVNFLSAEWVAQHSGMTVKRIRILMRANGLNPKNGRRLLARKASETLSQNAALLGIEPHEFDLTSPLAYLPMGSALKEFLETPQGVTELNEDTYEDAKKRIEVALLMGRDAGEFDLSYEVDIYGIAAWLASEGIK